jgi:ATP-dependent helicase Lhr and Lhr-like helicase
MQGPDAVASILAQLEGFDAPAFAWESEILPVRIAEYDPAWLDEQCLAGRIVWTRLAPRSAESVKGAAPVKATPIALLARRNMKLWSNVVEPTEHTQLSSKAQCVAEIIGDQGASFFDEIVDHSGMLPIQVEEALAELVALGLVNSDSFGGLRALLLPSERRRPMQSRRSSRGKRGLAIYGMQDAGRWALVRRGGLDSGRRPRTADRRPQSDPATIEHICRTLLARWGIVFWKVIDREANWLPPWRDLLLCLRRLEARGEIRGGRFVAGFSGEQFALPEAIGPLRDARRKAQANEYVSLSAADPLNLVGILTPGARVPSLTGNRVLYSDGVPIAALVGGETKFLEALPPEEQWRVQNLLLGRKDPSVVPDPFAT